MSLLSILPSSSSPPASLEHVLKVHVGEAAVLVEAVLIRVHAAVHGPGNGGQVAGRGTHNSSEKTGCPTNAVGTKVKLKRKRKKIFRE